MKNLRIAALLIAASLALTGCASASTGTSTGTESNGQSQTDSQSGTQSETPIDSSKIQIVASTNIWGSIAESVGGDLVQVTSIVNSAAQDPHSYEASARDQLAVKNADLLVINGAGYDDFAQTLADAGKAADVLKVADLVSSSDVSTNEHFWYNISAVGKTTYAIADELGAIDSANAQTYLANADKLIEGLTGIAAGYGEIKKKTEGVAYFATEPLAYWLLDDLGFVDKTPADFSKAIENESDVPPVAMKAALDLVGSGKIKVLVVNAQTENTQTNQIVAKAKAAGVAVVTLSELMPKGMAYVDWMGENLVALDKAIK